MSSNRCNFNFYLFPRFPQIILTTNKINYIYIYFSRLFFRKKKKNFPRSILQSTCARFTISSTGSSSPAILRPLIDDYVGSNRAQTGNSRFPLLFVSIPLRAPLGPTTIPLFIHFYTFENLLWECSTCNYYAVVAASTPHPPIPWIVARKARDALSLSEKNQPVILSRTLFSPPRQRILPPFPSYRFLSPALATNSLGDSLIFLPLFALDHYRAGTGVFTERILQERYTLLINQSRAYTSSPRFTQISLG